MKATEPDLPIRWVTAVELAVPTDFKGICDCPPDQIEKSHAELEKTSSEKLADFYDKMGTGEMRSLKTKLFFVAAMLLEQTGETGHKRQMVEQLQQLHRKNPLHPSLATVYRTAAPLKVWLAKKCGKKHALSVGELRADKKPLLLLTEENLLAIVAECKTARKFARQYRPKRKPKPTGSAPPAAPEKSPAKPAADQPGFLLVRGELSPAQRQKLVAILGDESRLLSLNKAQVATAIAWFEK